MSVSERIRAERERLGHTQEVFASFAEAGKRTLIGWEQGRATPDANALAALAEHGMDVLYVVTGKRSGEIDGTLLGMCEVALQQAYVAARPGKPAHVPVRISALSKVYNALQGVLSPTVDVADAARRAAMQYIDWVDDPGDPALLERALFRQDKESSSSTSPGHQVTAQGNSIATVGDVNIGHKNGRRKK